MKRGSYHDRQRTIEANARKRREARREERETHAVHVSEKVFDMLRETEKTLRFNCSVVFNSNTGRYTVHVGNTSRTFCEKDLTAYIAAEYARQHEVEMTDNIPEDDK